MKMEKMIIGVWLLYCVMLVAMLITVVLLAGSIANDINKRGLKNVIEGVWNGPTPTPAP